MNVIPEREHIAVAEDSAADFALVMADDAMAPLFPRGSSVQIQRRAVLRDGGFPRVPCVPLTAAEKEEVRGVLKQLGL